VGLVVRGTVTMTDSKRAKRSTLHVSHEFHKLAREICSLQHYHTTKAYRQNGAIALKYFIARYPEENLTPYKLVILLATHTARQYNILPCLLHLGWLDPPGAAVLARQCGLDTLAAVIIRSTQQYMSYAEIPWEEVMHMLSPDLLDTPTPPARPTALGMEPFPDTYRPWQPSGALVWHESDPHPPRKRQLPALVWCCIAQFMDNTHARHLLVLYPELWPERHTLLELSNRPSLPLYIMTLAANYDIPALAAWVDALQRTPEEIAGNIALLVIPIASAATTYLGAVHTLPAYMHWLHRTRRLTTAALRATHCVAVRDILEYAPTFPAKDSFVQVGDDTAIRGLLHALIGIWGLTKDDVSMAYEDLAVHLLEGILNPSRAGRSRAQYRLCRWLLHLFDWNIAEISPAARQLLRQYLLRHGTTQPAQEMIHIFKVSDQANIQATQVLLSETPAMDVDDDDDFPDESPASKLVAYLEKTRISHTQAATQMAQRDPHAISACSIWNFILQENTPMLTALHAARVDIPGKLEAGIPPMPPFFWLCRISAPMINWLFGRGILSEARLRELLCIQARFMAPAHFGGRFDIPDYRHNVPALGIALDRCIPEARHIVASEQRVITGLWQSKVLHSSPSIAFVKWYSVALPPAIVAALFGLCATLPDAAPVNNMLVNDTLWSFDRRDMIESWIFTWIHVMGFTYGAYPEAYQAAMDAAPRGIDLHANPHNNERPRVALLLQNSLYAYDA
jgi:hypothetical protein